MKINRKLDHKKIWMDSMIGMTWGFIASLIVGTVIGLFGMYSKANIFVTIKNVMSFATPAAIGIGIGYKAKKSPLQILAMGIGVFLIGHSSIIPTYANNTPSWLVHNFDSTSLITKHITYGLPGDVFGAWIGAVALVYFFEVFVWKSFIDLYLVPIAAIALGLAGSYSITYITSTVLILLEWLIDNTVMHSYWLAIVLAPVVGLLMGLALSLPTSSAAIAFTLSLHGYAATAAIAGTAAQMISFGVLTYMATGKIGKALAVGFGTSMLQMNNFIKRPRILLIPCFASALTALIAVAAFGNNLFPQMHNAKGDVVPSVTSGMGAAMLYGQIFTLKENGWGNYLGYINVVLQLLLPLLITYPLGKLAMKKEIAHKTWLKKEWMEIEHA